MSASFCPATRIGGACRLESWRGGEASARSPSPTSCARRGRRRRGVRLLDDGDRRCARRAGGRSRGRRPRGLRPRSRGRRRRDVPLRRAQRRRHPDRRVNLGEVGFLNAVPQRLPRRPSSPRSRRSTAGEMNVREAPRLAARTDEWTSVPAAQRGRDPGRPTRPGRRNRLRGPRRREPVRRRTRRRGSRRDADRLDRVQPLGGGHSSTPR